MRNLLKTSSVFVLPSEREGSSIVALEAMAAGVPLVTVDYPNNAAKDLARFNCCLVSKSNSMSIASSIQELLDNRALWCRMNRNAIKFAKEYNWDTVSTQMEDCMLKMVCDA
jgi:glycosyltransferase involved in cell wall biosynthesis